MVDAVGTAILAALALFGLGAAVIGWFYRRGATEREMALALKANTEATATASRAVGELSRELRSFRESTVDELHALKLNQVEMKASQRATLSRLAALENARAGAAQDVT